MSEYKTVDLNPKKIVGIALRTSNVVAEKEIPAHWSRFYQEDVMSKIPHKVSNHVYGLYTDYAGDHTQDYSLILGCEVSSSETVPKGLVCKELPSSPYAQYDVNGPFPQSCIETWQAIWETSYNRSFVGDFELYPPEFDPTNNTRFQIFIGLSRS